MGIFDFSRDAGSSILPPGEEEKLLSAAVMARSSTENLEQRAVLDDLNARIADRLTAMATDMGFRTTSLDISFDIAHGRVTMTGSLASQAEREKLVLLLGNHQGVAQVQERVQVEVPEPMARFYTVVKGDTLSRIAKAHYGDPLSYSAIFEANRPMLRDPDLIYPGQVLRIT